MSTSTRLGLAAVGLLFPSAGSLPARIAAPPSLPERVARADVVVTGTITRFEDRVVTTGDGEEYRVAVVKIGDAIVGARGLTHVRVGVPAGGLRIGRGGQLKLEEGQEACFFLRPVRGESFYSPSVYYNVMPKTGEDYKQNVELLKKIAGLLEDPSKGLKSSDPAARFLTAAVLIARYRTPPPDTNELTQEPVDAEESKLILQALADADWERPDPRLGTLQPLTLFLRLGVTPQDGFTRPQNFQDMPAEAKKWLRAKGDSYRVKKFVDKK